MNPLSTRMADAFWKHWRNEKETEMTNETPKRSSFTIELDHETGIVMVSVTEEETPTFIRTWEPDPKEVEQIYTKEGNTRQRVDKAIRVATALVMTRE